MGTILVTKKSRIKFLLGAYILGRVENLEIHKQKKKKKIHSGGGQSWMEETKVGLDGRER